MNELINNDMNVVGKRYNWIIKALFISSILLMNIHQLIVLLDVEITISVGDIVIIPIMTILLCHSLRSGFKEIFPWSLSFVLLIFSITISSYKGYVTPDISSSGISGYIRELSKTITCICYFYIGFNILRTINTINVVRLWAVGCAIFITYGLFANWAATQGLLIELIPNTNKLFFLGFYKDPNHAATYLNISIYILLYGLKKERLLIVKILYYLVNFMAIIALILTDSRGGLIAFLVSFAIFQIMSNWKNKWLMFFSFITIICIACATLALDKIVFQGAYTERLIISINNFGKGLSTRIALTQAALNLGNKFPIWGLGRGNFVLNSAEHLKEYPNMIKQVPHNTYAGVFAELGVVGFLFLISPLILIIKNLYINIKLELIGALSSHRRIMFICIGLVILIQGAVLNIENRREIWAGVGILCGISKLNKCQSKESENT